MKRGISVKRDWDYRGNLVTIVKKSRGKLTLEEVQNALIDDKLNADNWADPFYGAYVIVLKCPEGGEETSLFGDVEEGDAVTLYQLHDGDYCPVCGAVLPNFEYCPHCGEPWKGG